MRAFNSVQFHCTNSNKSTSINIANNNCHFQAFIISNDAIIAFLDNFHELHDMSTQVFPNKHLVIYPSIFNGNEIHSAPIFSHPSTKGNNYSNRTITGKSKINLFSICRIFAEFVLGTNFAYKYIYV